MDFNKHKPILEAVVIPALAATITGLFLAIAVLSYCILAEKPPAIAGLIGSIGAFAAWIFRTSPGAPQFPSLPAAQFQQVTKLHVISEGGQAGDYLNLPVERARLETFARGLAAGRGLTSREWTGKGALFSGSEFARLRGELIDRGFARWNSNRDARGGASLTAKGRAAFRVLAALPQPGTIGIYKSGL